ncbi:MAG: Holliday junction branch migration protein RuvA [Alistipes sp.]|nr:Holliday junction branch migration protein RuvA [Alistipes sp.]MBO5398629.1 Holliday junction branch migration protein RuvA [Alistipes sp.]MBP3474405.1 Holliday junction branch migration protein RuvA [Alistipes sp.]MBQ4539634.1 Holliday junction branch migration protein RuvA [Alistipes sp.]
MYEYISGLVAELAPTYAVVDAGGVGYYINISLQTYAAIEGEKSARLYVHFIVREDAQQLYGFATKLERELFRNLISVSGVGGNTARMILSTYSTSELRNIIATENAVLLKNVKGLGLKTAQKIIVELSGKMLELGADKEAVVATAAGGASNEIFDETMAALVMLGFQKAASEKVVKALLKESPTISVEEAVRQALRRL